MSTFRDHVYELTKQIPKGKVVTYGQLAKLAGKPKAARAIGLFMRTNPFAPHVPCHRVVAANGALTGYSGGNGLPTKRKMLEEEGVVFNDAGVDLKTSQWHPNSK